MPSLRSQWNDSPVTIGAWLSIASSVLAEAAAHTGFDFVCVDTQHGVIDYAATVPMFQAIELGGSAPIARVPWNEPGIIGRMLDGGAQGVIVPMVNTVAQAEAVVEACRYAPAGSRSYGPTAVGLRHIDYVGWAAEHIAVIAMIETAEAVRNIEEIVAVPGVDAIYLGPADLSLTLGLPPRNNDGVAAFDAALARIVEVCNRAGVVAGAHCVGGVAEKRMDQGFRLLTVASDIASMRQGMAVELASARASSPTPRSRLQFEE